MHGDEPKGVHVARCFLDLLRCDPLLSADVHWTVLPVANPDGFSRGTRRNAHRIDINRNFPTANWELLSSRSRMFGGWEPASEPETRALISMIERWKPNRIITIHSIGANRFCNNYDGPGRRLAKCLHGHNGYPVTDSIGYATPGSFGTWAGRERGLATVTLELPSTHSSKRCWDDNRDALLAAGSLV